MSSKTIAEIYGEYYDGLPEYANILSFPDYFGDKVVGRSAIQKIREAWLSEPQAFKIDKKKNMLTYLFPETTAYEINYLKDELPPQLNARKTSRSLILDLDEAESFFEMKFRKSLSERVVGMF